MGGGCGEEAGGGCGGGGLYLGCSEALLGAQPK